MNLMTAQTIAKSLMQEHGLIGWTFKFDGAKRRLGLCKYKTKTISLSRHLTLNLPEAEIRETLLHEIAHALTPGHNHDAVWRAKAISIGSNGNRCASLDAEQKVAPNWLAVCPNGHWLAERYRRPSAKRSCTRCSPRFNEAYLIRWVAANGRTLAQMQKQSV